MIILALDTGTVRTGYAILDDGELIRSGVFQMRGDLDGRLRQLWEHLSGLTGFYDLLAVEMPPGVVKGRRADTGLKIGMGVGVALGFAFLQRLPVLRVHHSTCKKSVTGRGNSNKEAVQQAVMARFGLDTVAEDEADAISVAVAAQALAQGVIVGGVL